MNQIMTFGSVALLGFSLLVTGCGGGGGNSNSGQASTNTTPTKTASSSEVADGTHVTEFQKRQMIGHYSTRDGKSGFTFDRTVDPPKGKLDGDTAAMPLKASGGFDNSTEYRSDDKRIWIRVAKSGHVELFQGPKQHEGERVVRDADAEPLK